MNSNFKSKAADKSFDLFLIFQIHSNLNNIDNFATIDPTSIQAFHQLNFVTLLILLLPCRPPTSPKPTPRPTRPQQPGVMKILIARKKVILEASSQFSFSGSELFRFYVLSKNLWKNRITSEKRNLGWKSLGIHIHICFVFSFSS